MLLSQRKVERVLKRLNVDPVRFLKLYENDTQKAPSIRWTREQLLAFEDYFARKQSAAAFWRLRHVLSGSHLGGMLDTVATNRQIDNYITAVRMGLVRRPLTQRTEGEGDSST